MATHWRSSPIHGVLCDFCNADGDAPDIDDNPIEMGGGLVGSSAVCQKCLCNTFKRFPSEVSETWDTSKTFGDNCRAYRKRTTGSEEGYIEIQSYD